MHSSYPAILYSAPDVDHPGTHGGSTHVEEAAYSLQKLSKHVYLLCSHKKHQPYIERKKNLTILRIPHFSSSILRAFSFFLFPFCIAFFLALFHRISLVYERGRIFGGGATLAGNLLGIDTIYEMIEPYTLIPVILGTIKKPSFKHISMEFWHNFIVQRADLITITHPSFLPTLPRKKAYFIHTGANPQRFQPRLSVEHLLKKYHLVRGKTILYVGSFSRWHACRAMILSLAPLIQKDQNIKFIMIGKGEHSSLCTQLIKRLHLTKNILQLGTIPLNHIPFFIAAADICFALFDRAYPPFRILDYYYSPIKIHEYKAMEKPIVASNIGTLKHYIRDGKNGYLVDEGNIPSITFALQKLLRNKPLQQRMGKRNRKEIIACYNWDYQNKKILQFISHTRNSP